MDAAESKEPKRYLEEGSEAVAWRNSSLNADRAISKRLEERE